MRLAAKPSTSCSFRRPAIVSPTTPLLRPEQRPDSLELFFSSSGRLSRAPFLAGMGCVLGAVWLYDRWVGAGVRLATGWVVLAVLLFSGCCLVSRRLHDLGRAGWWAGLLWVLFLAAWPLSVLPARQLCAAVLAMCAVVLCTMPGRAGPNRFGPALKAKVHT